MLSTKAPIADALVDASGKNGGIISKEDLAAYTVEELHPIHCNYRGLI